MENQDQTSPQEQAQQSQSGQSANAELRAFNETLKSENAALRSRVMSQDLKEIGLQPDAGLGLAIVESYEGRYEPGSVAEYARDKYQYSHEGGAPVESQAAQDVEQVQAQTDQLQATSVSAMPETQSDRLRAHDQRMADPEATRQDAQNALTDKLSAYRQATGR